jgi:hypothetical protein
MTQPLCSSATFDALVIIGLLTMLLLLAIAWIAQAYRRARLGGWLLDAYDDDYDAALNVIPQARLGEKLLAECGNDYESAYEAIAERARQNAEIDRMIAIGMRGMKDGLQ